MENSKSLAARAFAAISLFIGFYALALGIGLFLVSLPVLEIVFLHRIVAVKLLMLAFAGGFVVLWSIIPRPDKFEPPGPKLNEKEEPRLFSLISEVATKTNQAMPEEVYLVMDANAWVAQRGGAMGIGSKRVMGLGLPLMQALSVDQFRAVLAHEFGHYHGGDTKLGPWIYKTRAAIGRTLQNLGDESALQAPFRAYGKMFLKTTLSISRQQEYTADALAASVYGAKTMRGALRGVRDAALSFPPYFQSDMLPLLNRGYRPPLVEGFQRFMTAPEIAQKLASSFEEELKAQADETFDTHPPMPERLRALDALDDLSAPGDDKPSVTLLADVAKSEEELLIWLADNREIAAKLKAIPWENAPKVYLDSYQDLVNQNEKMLKGVTARTIPDIFAGSRNALEPLRNAAGNPVPPDDRPGLCLFLFGAAIAMSLVQRGWKLKASPGVFTFTDGEHNANPFELLTQLARNELTPEGWRATCDRLGIPEGELGETVKKSSAEIV